MNFVTRKHLRRRTFLKGAVAAIGLPLLDAMKPAFAAPSEDPARNPPCRMAFVYVPNGIEMPQWTPVAEGRDFDLPPILAPFDPSRDHVTVFSGLAQNGARPHCGFRICPKAFSPARIRRRSGSTSMWSC